MPINFKIRPYKLYSVVAYARINKSFKLSGNVPGGKFLKKWQTNSGIKNLPLIYKTLFNTNSQPDTGLPGNQ